MTTTTTGKLVCPECEAAGERVTFDRAQALGTHRFQSHGVRSAEALRREALGHAPKKARKTPPQPKPTEAKPAAVESLLVLEARKQLDDVTGPLRRQLAQLDTRIEEIASESKQLVAVRREIKSVLDKLDPQPKQPKSASAQSSDGVIDANRLRAERQLIDKADEVERYLTEHGNQWADGFTSNQLADALKDKREIVTRGISTKSAREVLDLLRERGVVRHDKVVRGGGMRFKVVTTNGDQP